MLVSDDKSSCQKQTIINSSYARYFDTEGNCRYIYLRVSCGVLCCVRNVQVVLDELHSEAKKKMHVVI